jgi:hypothetical protein
LSFIRYDEVFRTGYPTVTDFIDAMTVIRNYDYTTTLNDTVNRTVYSSLNWWEFDLYIGVLGLAFLAYFGVYLRFANGKLLDKLRYRALDMPLLVMTVLSFSLFYKVIATLPIPLVNSERVTTRFMIVPLMILLTLGCIRAQPFCLRC